jgi:hypothetical protein
MLAKLHLESLMGKKTPKTTRNTSKKLLTGSDAYDSAYKKAMERINGQVADSRDQAAFSKHMTKLAFETSLI